MEPVRGGLYFLDLGNCIFPSKGVLKKIKNYTSKHFLSAIRQTQKNQYFIIEFICNTRTGKFIEIERVVVSRDWGQRGEGVNV